jgi:hypothetical protein
LQLGFGLPLRALDRLPWTWLRGVIAARIKAAGRPHAKPATGAFAQIAGKPEPRLK